jgi:hypothetical protein
VIPQSNESFVIAVKRECRTQVPPDWLEIVRGTSGLTVVGDASPYRVQVRASPEAIQRVQERLGDYLHIEKLIPHYRS